MVKSSILPNPFTPKSGIEPKVFLGREKEIEVFEKKLEAAIEQKKYDHFLILGEWGVGKTSLLREFKKITQVNKVLCSYISIRSFQENDTFLAATKHLATSLANLPVKYKVLKSFTEYLKGIEFNLPFVGGGIQVPEKKEIEPDPQVLLFNVLKKLWNSVKKETKGIVVLLDDVQNYQPISDYLTIIKNVLSEDTIVKDTGFLFVLASTPGAWNEFLKKHHPIGRYFTPIVKLGRLNFEQVLTLLDKTLESSGVEFDEEIKKKVYEYSEGHPFELQLLCNFLYDNQIGGKVNEDSWDVSLDTAITHLGEILFDYMYDSASPTEKEVLRALSEKYTPVESKTLSKRLKRFKSEDVNKYLNRLAAKKLVVRKERGVFALPDRMFREYVLRKG